MASENPPSAAARWALPALILASVALACGPWLVRLAGSVSHVGPISGAFWRLALALPVLLIAGRWSGERLPFSWGRPISIAGLAGFFFAADLALWHVGILHTRLSNATLLGNITALLYPIYGFFVVRALPSRRQGFALLLATAGAVLLLGRSYELASRNLLGDLACIAAGLCYTAYLIAIERARRSLGPIATLILAMVAGLPFLLVAANAAGETILPVRWWPLLLLALGSQIVGQGLILLAVSRVPPLVVGLTLLVQPVVASAIGWLIYGETLTMADLTGGLAIAAAVLLVRDPKRAKVEMHADG